MSRVTVGVLSAVCALLLAGCTSEATGPSAQSTSPTASEAAPTPTPTPTPTPGVDDLSDPALGIVFEETPALEGDAADVHNWIATYEKEYWRTLTTNQVSPAFALIGSAEVQARQQDIADNNAADQATIGGTMRVRIKDIVVTGDTATGSACTDYGDATFADVNGTYTPAEAGFDPPVVVNFTLARVAAENRWIILTYDVPGRC